MGVRLERSFIGRWSSLSLLILFFLNSEDVFENSSLLFFSFSWSSLISSSSTLCCSRASRFFTILIYRENSDEILLVFLSNLPTTFELSSFGVFSNSAQTSSTVLV
jgi:hypothetical protein